MQETKEMVISLDEYKRFLKQESKYKQLRDYLIRNINNNQIIKALEVIEGKNWYELIDELKKEGKQ